MTTRGETRARVGLAVPPCSLAVDVDDNAEVPCAARAARFSGSTGRCGRLDRSEPGIHRAAGHRGGSGSETRSDGYASRDSAPDSTSASSKSAAVALLGELRSASMASSPPSPTCSDTTISTLLPSSGDSSGKLRVVEVSRAWIRMVFMASFFPLPDTNGSSSAGRFRETFASPVTENTRN